MPPLDFASVPDAVTLPADPLEGLEPGEPEETASEPGHDHVTFSSASLVTALVCHGCGTYVSGDRQAEHQEFHDRLARAELASGEGVPGV